MDIQTFIQDWLAAGNAYDIDLYLKQYHKDAVLDDPSVGRSFVGHKGIRKYFEDYFIGYKTQTRLVTLEIISKAKAHIEVEFTGAFPEGKIGGRFDFTFKEGKILSVKADLL
ncbi:MAG: nuclear transport factor 2 family protein [Chitinophagaceae bacterium]|nr:MAG: nuclear transport factor 2 family protein [Chitinophagaceae bacterium]